MRTKGKMPTLRLAGAVLCAAASLLLLASSLHLLAAGGSGPAAALLLVGLGLFAAALKAFKSSERS